MKNVILLISVYLLVSCSKSDEYIPREDCFTINGERHKIVGMYIYIGYDLNHFTREYNYYSVVILSDIYLDDISSGRYIEIVHNQYCVPGATLIMFGRQLGTDSEFEYQHQLEDSTYATINYLDKYKPTFYIKSNGKSYEKISRVTTINNNSYSKFGNVIDFSGKLESGEEVTCYFGGRARVIVTKQ